MKKLIFIFLFVFCLTSQAQTYTISEARRLLLLQKQELIDSKALNKNLSQKLNDMTVEVMNSENRLKELQVSMDSVRQWGIDQQNQSVKNFNTMMNEKKEKEHQIMLKEKAIKKYHFCKLLNAITVAILAFMFGLSLMKYVPPIYAQYAFAVPILTTSLGFALVWFIL